MSHFAFQSQVLLLMSIRFGVYLWFVLWAGALPAQSPAGPPALNTSTSAEGLPEAFVLYRSGKFEAAAERYRRILALDPANPIAYAGLTRTLLKEKNIAGARTTINKALQTADSPDVHVALGEVEFREGLIAEAEGEWVTVINAGHPYGRAFLGISRLSDALSLHKRARAMIEKAHEFDPGDADVRKAWQDTLKPSDRIKYLEDYLSRDTSDDAETRSDLQRYLEYLKSRQLEPKRGCRLVSKQTSTEAPLLTLLEDAQHLRGYGLEVTLGDRKAKLLLDTGSGGILINRALAQKVGLQRLSETRIGGLGDHGDVSGYVALAPSIKIGGLEFQDCPVEVIDRRSVAGEDGLVGADVFEKFLVELDFANQKLRLSELPHRPEQASQELGLSAENDESQSPDRQASQTGDSAPPAKPAASAGPFDRYVAPEMKSYTPVLRFGHLLLVPTQINAEKKAKFFLIDSGAFTTQLSLNAAKTVTKVHVDDTLSVRGVSGAVSKVYVADEATLVFAGLRQPTKDVVVFDLKRLSDDVGFEVSGIVGFTTLRFLDVKIDYRDGLVHMEYKGPQWLVR
jgi:tetratricopeptide (TPR) repeat protein